LVTSATLGARELHGCEASGRVQVSPLRPGLSVVVQVSTPEDPRRRRCSNQGTTRWGRKPVWRRRHGRADDKANLCQSRWCHKTIIIKQTSGTHIYPCRLWQWPQLTIPYTRMIQITTTMPCSSVAHLPPFHWI